MSKHGQSSPVAFQNKLQLKHLTSECLSHSLLSPGMFCASISLLVARKWMNTWLLFLIWPFATVATTSINTTSTFPLKLQLVVISSVSRQDHHGIIISLGRHMSTPIHILALAVALQTYPDPTLHSSSSMALKTVSTPGFWCRHWLLANVGILNQPRMARIHLQHTHKGSQRWFHD